MSQKINGRRHLRLEMRKTLFNPAGERKWFPAGSSYVPEQKDNPGQENHAPTDGHGPSHFPRWQAKPPIEQQSKGSGSQNDERRAGASERDPRLPGTAA